MTWNGIVSRSKRPSSVAWWASRCERTASSSSSERGISHWSAIISADRPCGIRLYFSISSGGHGEPTWSIQLKPTPIGTWPMCSTPLPMTVSWTPAAISAAPKLYACWAEPHWRSTVVAGVSIGSPACSQALRPTLNICSPYCCTQPAMTSSTSEASIPARSMTSVKHLPRSSLGWVSL